MISPSAIEKGTVVAGRYVVEEAIGQGRSSVVYKALDLGTRSAVALKLLDPDLAHDPVAAERFRREATILRNLQHPGIVKVYDLFEHDGWTFIAMELFAGMNAKAYVDRYGPLSVAELVTVAKSLFSVLDACHKARVIHRDIKPHNVLLDGNGALRVIDFGVSKMTVMTDLTKTGAVVGTPEYTAPEAFRSRRYDSRADIYGAGATLYELLTARPPYLASSLGRVLDLQMRAKIEPIESFRKDVPAWLQRLVLRCLRTSPDERYQSASEVLYDLEQGDARDEPADRNLEPASCIQCGGTLVSGLSFCHHCGSLRSVAYEAGRFHLLLTRCAEPDRFVQTLVRTYPGLTEKKLRARLRHLPMVLVGDVSRKTAVDLQHQLAPTRAEVRLVNRLLTTFELSGIYVLLAFAIFIPALWLQSTTSAGLIVTGTLFSEALIYFLYWHRTLPLVSPKGLHRSTGAGIGEQVRPLVLRTKGLRSERLRTQCAHLLRSLIAFQKRSGPGPAHVGDVRGAVAAALDGAEALDAYEVYLAASSINDLREKLTVIERRLSRNPDLEETQKLIETKAHLEREITNYQEIEDQYSAIAVSLVNLQSALARLADARDEQAARQWWSEVQAATPLLASFRSSSAARRLVNEERSP